ncbi:DUF2130 domain-containing protein [Acetobacteraceae bacterium]|nr:DUF2130 domain-containing protein [Acetobacteraceae bacterium]
MNEIKCPYCGKEVPVEATAYAAIVKQVHDQEFYEALTERLKLIEEAKEKDLELVEERVARDYDKKSAEAQDRIKDLERKLQTFEEKQKQFEADKKQVAELAESRAKDESRTLVFEAEKKIQALEGKLREKETETKLAVTEAVSQAEKERDKLKNDLDRSKLERESAENSLKESYEVKLRDRESEIQRLQDMKARLSTKMVGETLEQHCEIEFNKNRALGFQTAYFEKDNDARTGSKGDYIFKESDLEGNEIVSIMFEMKNENSETATKKKNEDFFKELDKDRREKKCEYAVLVSMLEADNDYYNTGIVDVSHRYEKMYVIRPQFFMQLIGLLRNSGQKSLEYKAELAQVKAQNLDVTNFENKLVDFQNAFGKNYETASKHFQKAIEEIDKSISHLEKTRKALVTTDNQLRLANDKAQSVSIKKLTRGNPTMSEKFKKLEE